MAEAAKSYLSVANTAHGASIPLSANRFPAPVEEMLAAWVHGWTLARAASAAVPLAGKAFRVDVGLPGHMVRYVLPGHDMAMVRQLAHSLDEPGTWLKVCAAPEIVAPLLPRRWTLDAPLYFMQIGIALHLDLSPPAGYTLHIANDGAVLAATILSADRQIAAKGRLALSGHFAIFDQIQTDPAHRRKGLGKFLMLALGNRARSEGANHGLLVATEEGQKLYRTIGWQLICPYASAFII
jgi:GNAT superfamily N-acetyltransferase